MEQLLAMRPGDFIELERQPRIKASVGGIDLFACQYGTHNAKYAIRIEERLHTGDAGWTGKDHGY